MTTPSLAQILSFWAFCLMALLVAAGRGVGAEPAAASKNGWHDLPTRDLVVRRLIENDGFLGSKDEGWDKLAKSRFFKMDCVFLPEGAMVREQPKQGKSSDIDLAKWFAKAFVEEKVGDLGTCLTQRANAHIYSRGPEMTIYPHGEVKVESFRKRGNVLELRAIATGPSSKGPMRPESPWWPILDLDLGLGRLAAGAYALEVIWYDKQGDEKTKNDKVFRQLTAFTVVGDEPGKKDR